MCASVSCPDVALTAYKPETLQADMEANMRRFLENPKKGLALDKSKNVITLSKVSTFARGLTCRAVFVFFTGGRVKRVDPPACVCVTSLSW